MNYRTFSAGSDDDGRRLDRILRKFIPEMNLSLIYKFIRKGFVKLNGKNAKPESRVHFGDEIKLSSFIIENKIQSEKKSPSRIKNEFSYDSYELNIIFKSKDFLIINKPYGISVHGKENSLDKMIKKFYEKNFSSSSLSFSPGPLHRLDENTTGLLVFSLSIEGARWFSANIKNHSIKKEYLGIADGILKEKQEWKDFLDLKNKNSDDQNGFKTVKTSADDSNGEKFSETLAEPLFYGKYGENDFTLVKYKILTGRTHQIRAQSSLHGYPLLGDVSYGGKKINAERMFFLHAKTLFFPENNLALPEKIECPLDLDYKNFLKRGNCETENLSL